MKRMEKTLAFLLCAVMILGMLPTFSFAADGEANFYMTVSAEEVEEGDTFTVTVGYYDMTVDSFAFGFDFNKDLLEVTKITVDTLEYYDEENDEGTIATATEKSTKAEANESGHVGVAFARGTETECYGKAELLTVTFKAIATGTVEFEMFEDSSGADGYKGEWTATQTVTIVEPTLTQEYCYPITSLEELTTGQYILTIEAGYAMGVYDNGWVTAWEYTFGEGIVTGKTIYTWTVTVDGSVVKLQDSNGNYIAPKSGNTNGIQVMEYTWGVICNDGKFSFYGQGSDTTTLAGNSSQGYKFRSYRTATVTGSPNGYPNQFTLYKLGTPCAHESTKLVSNNNGTHNVVCAADGCGYVVNENVTCTGTDDGDCTTAVTCACDYVVTAAKTAHTAGADDGDCTTAVKCVNCDKDAVAAKDHSFNTKASTTLASEADCNNAATYYVKCDHCDAVSDTKTVAVGDAKGHGHTAGFRYDSNGDNTHSVICKDCGETTQTNVACSDGNDADELCDFCGNNLHVCEGILTAGKAATCAEDGWEAYYTCSCGELYADKDCTTEITLDEWKTGDGKIAATGDHVYVPGTYTWSGDHSTCTVVGTCACGATTTATASSTSSVTTVGTCQTAEVVTYTADFAETWAVDQSKDVTGEKDLNNHTSTDVTYTNNGDTHSATYDCCGGAYVTNDDHDYTTGTSEYTCICGKVQEFTLYVLDNAGTSFYISVPYGATIRDYIPDEAYTGITYLNKDYKIGYDKFESWVISNSYETMPAETVYVTPRVEFHGWYHGSNGWLYCDGSNDYVKSGWTLINHADYLENGTGSDWYYLDPVTGYRAEGLTRVPYPTVEINGVTYAPNAEDVAYAESKGKTFIDKDEAWFIFDENGKFQSDVTGKYEGTYATCYAVDGMIPWHYGLAKIANKYYYFVGDAVNGGNKIANGPVWITRTNGIEGLEKGACYYFLGGVQAHNLTDIVDGKYYENGKLMMGAGLVKLEEGYIYVRSNGQVALGEYWVTEAKANGYVEGGKLYNFGEDGILTIDPEKNGIIDGVYYKEGVPYYAGLIEIDGDYYYVRSNGEVATGWYYVTKTNGIDFGTNKLYFGEDGKLQDVKNGIYEGEDGKLYYYVNNRVTGAGLIKIGDDYYYAKTSTGEIVTGTYYITVTNGMEGFTAGQKCVFDENGKLVK